MNIYRFVCSHLRIKSEDDKEETFVSSIAISASASPSVVGISHQKTPDVLSL